MISGVSPKLWRSPHPILYTGIADPESFLTTNDGISELFANANASSTGQGGFIEVRAERLTVANGAQINASSQGAGSAGSLRLNVGVIVRLNGGSLQAEA